MSDLLIKNNYGFNNYTIKKLFLRAELSLSLVGDQNAKTQYDALINYMLMLVHLKHDYRLKLVSNLALLDMILCYRGWRHFKGLPLRGQRTWTNGWTAFKKPNVLKKLKLKIARNAYGNFQDSTLATATAAEQYNTMWYRQWRSEWSENKKRRLKYVKKSKNVCIMDLNATAQGKISGSNRAAKAGKKKRVYKKNSFTIGFGIGTTRWLLSESQTSASGSPVALKSGQLIQVLISAPTEKKKVQKKVSAQKKQQDKLAKAKKKKTVLKQKGAELKRLKTQKLKNIAKSRK